MSADEEGAGAGGGETKEGGAPTEIVPSPSAVPTSNEAADLLVRTDPSNPPGFAMVYAGKKYKIAATASAAGALAAIVGLFVIFTAGNAAAAVGLVMLLSIVAGGCATSVVMHGRLADQREHLAKAYGEIDRKAEENKKLLGHVLRIKASSVPEPSAKNVVKPHRKGKEKK